jgi:hypothetical protein
MTVEATSSAQPLKTAVLFLVFNRPDTTARVFNEIRKARPPRLYVAADGPRADRAGEIGLVESVRMIATDVDWPCEVRTLYRKDNLGCKLAVSGAITWFFEQEEEGIILEDDTLPSPSFFWFCQELLERYRDDERIFIISGYNKQNQWNADESDYFFSYFGGIWGWASWRRAWKYYDIDMTDLERNASKGFFEHYLGKKLGGIRKKQLLSAKINNINGKMNTWDYPWAYSRHLHGGIACVPAVSLVTNIGFSERATHTKGKNLDKVYRNEIRFPVRFNDNIVADKSYDLLFISRPGIVCRVLKWINSLVKL